MVNPLIYPPNKRQHKDKNKRRAQRKQVKISRGYTSQLSQSAMDISHDTIEFVNISDLARCTETREVGTQTTDEFVAETKHFPHNEPKKRSTKKIMKPPLSMDLLGVMKTKSYNVKSYKKVPEIRKSITSRGRTKGERSLVMRNMRKRAHEKLIEKKAGQNPDLKDPLALCDLQEIKERESNGADDLRGTSEENERRETNEETERLETNEENERRITNDENDRHEPHEDKQKTKEGVQQGRKEPEEINREEGRNLNQTDASQEIKTKKPKTLSTRKRSRKLLMKKLREKKLEKQLGMKFESNQNSSGINKDTNEEDEQREIKEQEDVGRKTKEQEDVGKRETKQQEDVGKRETKEREDVGRRENSWWSDESSEGSETILSAEVNVKGVTNKDVIKKNEKTSPTTAGSVQEPINHVITEVPKKRKRKTLSMHRVSKKRLMKKLQEKKLEKRLREKVKIEQNSSGSNDPVRTKSPEEREMMLRYLMKKYPTVQLEVSQILLETTFVLFIHILY